MNELEKVGHEREEGVCELEIAGKVWSRNLARRELQGEDTKRGGKDKMKHV